MRYLLRNMIVTVASALLLLPMAGCDAGESSQCSVLQQDNGTAKISCPDGSSAVVSGPMNTLPASPDGSMSCTAVDNDDGTKTISCPDGSEFTINDGNSCTIVEEDGQKIMRCDDGTEAVLGAADGTTDPVGDGTDPTVVPDDVLAEELSAEELAEIDVLRDAIEQGIGVGDEEYIEKVTLSLQTAGVLDDYESAIGEGWSNVEEAVSTCPFAEYYNNGFQPNGVNCDFLVELAQLDAYAALTEALDDSELPTDVQDGPYSEEANFWYEQGAVSGIEQRRVLVRADLREQAMCSTKPTPNEGAFDKGYTVGGQAMADAFNDWLAENGHVADYPTMATPIEVCNVNASVLDPAYQNAKDVLPTLLETMPLCEDYVAPTQQHALEYAQAMIQYEAGVEAGMDAEYSLAAVRIFREIPCNVSDPIVLDLDGDGLELLPVHRGVNFDFYDVGREQAVAWVGPDDALLVLDRNADGMITNGGELFGNIDQNYADGFAQMAELDANGDGVLSADDPAWASLAAWRDINTDGQSQAGELLSMDDIGLTAIPVSGVRVTMRSGGNRIPWVATAVGTSGDMLVGDALLRTAPWASPSF